MLRCRDGGGRLALMLVTCTLGGCNGEDPKPACERDDKGFPTWQVALDGADLDRALLSAWGSGPKDVYAVGGPLGNPGFATLAVHYDGCTWRELEPGGTETYWWVSGSSATDVWMVGQKGRITHYDGAKFVEHESGTTATLWGVWAASPTDAWAVGGTPEGAATDPDDVILHWDGQSWTAEALPGTPLGRALLKVWGPSSEDLYVVGELGVIWHRKGTTWMREAHEPPLASGTLFTVAGCSATEIYAVGGRDVLRSDGQTWTKLDVALTNDASGVSCAAPGAVAIVGFGGMKQRLVGGSWIDEFDLEPHNDLHGVWADPTGAFWAAGGQFVDKASSNPRAGVVARYGEGRIATTVER